MKNYDITLEKLGSDGSTLDIDDVAVVWSHDPKQEMDSIGRENND